MQNPKLSVALKTYIVMWTKIYYNLFSFSFFWWPRAERERERERDLYELKLF